MTSSKIGLTVFYGEMDLGKQTSWVDAYLLKQGPPTYSGLNKIAYFSLMSLTVLDWQASSVPQCHSKTQVPSLLFLHALRLCPHPHGSHVACMDSFKLEEMRKRGSSGRAVTFQAVCTNPCYSHSFGKNLIIRLSCMGGLIVESSSWAAVWPGRRRVQGQGRRTASRVESTALRKNAQYRTSLVLQWLRIHLPMQRTGV